MEALYFTAKIDEECTLYLAPLTNRHIAAAEPLDKIDGYFLFEQRGAGDFADVQIIAHVPNEEGALWLRERLGMS